MRPDIPLWTKLFVGLSTAYAAVTGVVDKTPVQASSTENTDPACLPGYRLRARVMTASTPFASGNYGQYQGDKAVVQTYTDANGRQCFDAFRDYYIWPLRLTILTEATGQGVATSPAWKGVKRFPVSR